MNRLIRLVVNRDKPMNWTWVFKLWSCSMDWEWARDDCVTNWITHYHSLGRSSEKKCLPDFLFWFLLHMTPRLWEDVLELQKQAKLKDNVIFSARGAHEKSLGTYFHVKLKNKLVPLSSLFLILAFFGLKKAFFVILHPK